MSDQAKNPKSDAKQEIELQEVRLEVQAAAVAADADAQAQQELAEVQKTIVRSEVLSEEKAVTLARQQAAAQADAEAAAALRDIAQQQAAAQAAVAPAPAPAALAPQSPAQQASSAGSVVIDIKPKGKPKGDSEKASAPPPPQKNEKSIRRAQLDEKRNRSNLEPVRMDDRGHIMTGKKALQAQGKMPMTATAIAMAPGTVRSLVGNVRKSDRDDLLTALVTGEGIGEIASWISIIAKSFAGLKKNHMDLAIAEIEAAYKKEPKAAKLWEEGIVYVAAALNISAAVVTQGMAALTIIDKEFFYKARELVMSENPAKKTAGALAFYLYFTTTYPLKQWIEVTMQGITNGVAAATSVGEGLLSARSWDYKAKKITEGILHALTILPQLTVVAVAKEYQKEMGELLGGLGQWYADLGKRLVHADGAADALKQYFTFVGTHLAAGVMAHLTQGFNSIFALDALAEPLARRFNESFNLVANAKKGKEDREYDRMEQGKGRPKAPQKDVAEAGLELGRLAASAVAAPAAVAPAAPEAPVPEVVIDIGDDVPAAAQDPAPVAPAGQQEAAEGNQMELGQAVVAPAPVIAADNVVAEAEIDDDKVVKAVEVHRLVGEESASNVLFFDPDAEVSDVAPAPVAVVPVPAVPAPAPAADAAQAAEAEATPRRRTGINHERVRDVFSFWQQGLAGARQGQQQEHHAAAGPQQDGDSPSESPRASEGEDSPTPTARS